jgi:hypothetical protein
MCSGKVGAVDGSMMTVYSEVESASGSGRRGGRMGVVGVVVGAAGGCEGVMVAAITEGVVVCPFRFLREATLAKEIGGDVLRGGKVTELKLIVSTDEIESCEGGRGRVEMGG